MPTRKEKNSLGRRAATFPTMTTEEESEKAAEALDTTTFTKSASYRAVVHFVEASLEMAKDGVLAEGFREGLIERVDQVPANEVDAMWEEVEARMEEARGSVEGTPGAQDDGENGSEREDQVEVQRSTTENLATPATKDTSTKSNEKSLPTTERNSDTQDSREPESQQEDQVEKQGSTSNKLHTPAVESGTSTSNEENLPIADINPSCNEMSSHRDPFAGVTTTISGKEGIDGTPNVQEEGENEFKGEHQLEEQSPVNGNVDTSAAKDTSTTSNEDRQSTVDDEPSHAEVRSHEDRFASITTKTPGKDDVNAAEIADVAIEATPSAKSSIDTPADSIEANLAMAKDGTHDASFREERVEPTDQLTEDEAAARYPEAKDPILGAMKTDASASYEHNRNLRPEGEKSQSDQLSTIVSFDEQVTNSTSNEERLSNEIKVHEKELATTPQAEPGEDSAHAAEVLSANDPLLGQQGMGSKNNDIETTVSESKDGSPPSKSSAEEPTNCMDGMAVDETMAWLLKLLRWADSTPAIEQKSQPERNRVRFEARTYDRDHINDLEAPAAETTDPIVDGDILANAIYSVNLSDAANKTTPAPFTARQTQIFPSLGDHEPSRSNPFYRSDMTLALAAQNIVAYFREAVSWLVHYHISTPASVLVDLSLKPASTLNRIFSNLHYTAEFLRFRRKGWDLRYWPDNFFEDVLALVMVTCGKLEKLEDFKGCGWIMGKAWSKAVEVGEGLVAIREDRRLLGKERWERRARDGGGGSREAEGGAEILAEEGGEKVTSKENEDVGKVSGERTLDLAKDGDQNATPK